MCGRGRGGAAERRRREKGRRSRFLRPAASGLDSCKSTCSALPTTITRVVISAASVGHVHRERVRSTKFTFGAGVSEKAARPARARWAAALVSSVHASTCACTKHACDPHRGGAHVHHYDQLYRTIV